MKVIIADDSLTIQRIVQNMLREMGMCDCLVADGGDVVLQLLEANSDVGLVLLDWNMPVMDGLNCLRAIRARAETASLPVIMVTSEVTRARVMEAVQAGASNYLVKPFDLGKFRSVVGAVLK